MIKATDLIKKEYRYITSNDEEHDSLEFACYKEAYILVNFKAKPQNYESDNIDDYLQEKKKRIHKIAARFEREFLNEEYSKPDLDENSALLTLYVDAKNDILSLENIIEATTLPYYMVKELEKDLFRWCKYEQLNKKSGFYKILACIDEIDNGFDSVTVWYFEVRSYKPEVGNEN